jgi:predicted amino acid-binding ACT domain protein
MKVIVNIFNENKDYTYLRTVLTKCKNSANMQINHVNTEDTQTSGI